MDSEIESKLDQYLARTDEIIAAAATSKGGGAWNAPMIVGHLTDAARVNVGRLHAKAAGATPMGDWDQEGFVKQFAYDTMPVEHLSREFRSRREAFVAAGRRLLGGGLDAEYLVARLDGSRDHDAEHLNQLRGG